MGEALERVDSVVNVLQKMRSEIDTEFHSIFVDVKAMAEELGSKSPNLELLVDQHLEIMLETRMMMLKVISG